MSQAALIDVGTIADQLAANGWTARTIGPHRDGLELRRRRQVIHLYACGLATLHDIDAKGHPSAAGIWRDPIDAWIHLAAERAA